MFLTRIFRNLDLGIEWVLRCKAMELESLRFIVSRLERVVVVRPTYALKNNTLYTCKQPLMMAYKGSKSARDNFGKFIHQFQPEIT